MIDLSGIWLGTYWQKEIPTRFELSLIQGGNILTGSILDDSYLGEAQVAGEISQSKIIFSKRYLSGSRHAVTYVGKIGEDGNSMQGHWRIGASETGSWEAHRTEDNLSLDLSVYQNSGIKSPNL